jgi:hypothetical protein
MLSTAIPLSRYADLPSALASAPTCLDLDCACPVVSANVTIQVGTTLRYAGGQLQPAAGLTVNVLGPIMAPPVQIFGGGGNVLIGDQCLDEAYVEWWGAIADGQTDAAPAINRALASLPPYGGTVALKLAGHNYAIGSSIGIINNAANQFRRNQALWGKGHGRRGNDTGSGTCLWWTGNSTDPAIRLYSRNCHLYGLTFYARTQLAVAIDQDAPASYNLAQIVTANHIEKCYVSGQSGRLTFAMAFGESGCANNEHNKMESCQFEAAAVCAIEMPNGTGQSKFVQFHDCSFTDSPAFVRVAIASPQFVDCNFSNVTPDAMGLVGPGIRFAGGSYEPVSLVRCDSESCQQFGSFGGVSQLHIEGCRFSCNATPLTAPPLGGEYLCGSGQMSIIGCLFDGTRAGFRIRPSNEAPLFAESCDFGMTEFLPKDSTSWQFISWNCANIASGTHQYLYLCPPTQFDGTVRITPVGSPLNAPSGHDITAQSAAGGTV